MNFLAHAVLAEPGSDGFLFGNLIADGVRGSRLYEWPQDIALGIRHHRRVDATIDHHPTVIALRRRIEGPERRVAGIAFDLLWDHFLAQDCLAEPAGRALIERSYRVLEQGEQQVPPRVATTISLLRRHDWLSSYADFDFTCQAISGLGERLTGVNRLAQLLPWIRAHRATLAAAFRDLWPDMLSLRDECRVTTAAQARNAR
ncbi:acyl carrier protein phosphodiesterase [Kushneria sinocarnis]|uniref:Acyl carrier protein phosphodiesterase n=1 Tax=Kushneria sinocarnis TaxID=595502 RepID=A0A420WYF9_9GAMM|nr:ACP phosphodiesterase [Kushneria sinocarnis]RKR06223.1 acyl carrier protein phosphodiesterase [Kushneria sinocarnis]